MEDNMIIAKKVVDELTSLEKRLLIKYIKETMRPPQTPPKVNNIVSFK